MKEFASYWLPPLTQLASSPVAKKSDIILVFELLFLLYPPTSKKRRFLHRFFSALRTVFKHFHPLVQAGFLCGEPVYKLILRYDVDFGSVRVAGRAAIIVLAA